MEHDPFCKAYYPDLLEVERCAWCMVIRRVREDERRNAYGNGYTDAIADDMKLSSLEDLDVEYWVGYNKGYLDGYTDAETEFTNPCCFCGHDEFSTYVCDDCKEEEFWNEDMSENADNIKMSASDDNDGWYTNGTTYMTKEHIINQWNELFDNNPWLEGFAADEECGVIDCCQKTEPEDWLVFDQVTTLLWLTHLENEKVLSKDLIQKIGGTQ